MKGKYLPILIAALTWAQIASSQTWIAAHAPHTNFYAVAYSTNGDKVAAASMGVYTSTNFGLDWKLTSAPALPFFTIACSSDGNQIFASVYHGPIYASRDSGLTWNILNTPGTNWSAVACSPNGNILLAANGTSGGALYTSTNSGVSWSPTPGVLTGDWWAVALSADGKKLFAETSGAKSYVSTDSGSTWNLTGAASAFTISSDGQKFIGGASGVFISTNSGISGALLPWPSSPGFTATIFGPISMSADGLSVIGDELCGALYTSEDGGTNWSLVPNLGGSLNTVAESPNGAWRLIAEDFGGVQISYVPESVPLFIAQPVAATNLYEGTTLILNASALGSAPIMFQWQHNGTNLSDDARITGSATSELTISNLQVSDSGTYTLIATNSLGMTNCESLLTVIPDVERPSLTITTPRAREKWAAAGFQVSGTVTDNSQVAGVWFQLDSGPWTPAGTSDGWHTWYASFNPTNGANTISAYAVDQVGNASLTNSVSFSAIPQSPMSVRTSGQGRVTPNYDSQILTVGSRYKMTAHPAHGYIFAGWSGNLQALTPTLPFIMQEDLSVEADFVPNPFPAVRGKYSGISETNSPIPSPRMLKVQVSANGAFAAMLDNYHFSGKFSADGMASHSFSPKGIPPLLIQLQVDLIGGNTVTGTVTVGGVPSSTIIANKISGHQ